MRIAYITADPGVPIFGQKGCSIHVQEVLRALVKRGAHVDLFATNCSAGRKGPAVSGSSASAAAVSSYEACEMFGLPHVRLHPLPASPKGELALREKQCLAVRVKIRLIA